MLDAGSKTNRVRPLGLLNPGSDELSRRLEPAVSTYKSYGGVNNSTPQGKQYLKRINFLFTPFFKRLYLETIKKKENVFV